MQIYSAYFTLISFYIFFIQSFQAADQYVQRNGKWVILRTPSSHSPSPTINNHIPFVTPNAPRINPPPLIRGINYPGTDNIRMLNQFPNVIVNRNTNGYPYQVANEPVPPTILTYSTVPTPTAYAYPVNYGSPNGEDGEDGEDGTYGRGGRGGKGGEGAPAPPGWIKGSTGRSGNGGGGGGGGGAARPPPGYYSTTPSPTYENDYPTDYYPTTPEPYVTVSYYKYSGKGGRGGKGGKSSGGGGGGGGGR